MTQNENSDGTPFAAPPFAAPQFTLFENLGSSNRIDQKTQKKKKTRDLSWTKKERSQKEDNLEKIGANNERERERREREREREREKKKGK